MKPRLTNSQRAVFALVAGLSVITLVAAAAVAVRYATSPDRNPAARFVTVNLGTPIAGLQVDAAVRVTAPDDARFRMLDGGGNNHEGDPTASGWFVRTSQSFTLLATERSLLGCHVYFDSAAKEFVDPCGGSVFAIDGSVIHGPAAFGLSHLVWHQVGPESIAIETVPAS